MEVSRMKLSLRLPKVVAGLLVASLAGSLEAPLAAGSASLNGRVVSAGTGSPLAGVRVHVADPRTREIRSSEATTADGSFSVRGLEPATYSVAVESAGGLYVVDSPVALAAGKDRAIELAVQPAPQKDAPAEKTPKTSVWENPLTATLIVVGAAIVVGAIVGSGNNASTPASPSAP
jgi:hypothetical protein